MKTKNVKQNKKSKNSEKVVEEKKVINDSLYIVMPAYNEEETIEGVVSSWYPVLELANDDSRIVVADNNSKDKTYDILVKLKKKYPKLDVIKNEIKGHGPTMPLKKKLISFFKQILMVKLIQMN